jgi:transposase InsO family protein
MIDPATGWFEIAEIPAKTADVVAIIFETAWLTRYPYPTEVVMDRGVEFMGEVRKTLEKEYGARLKVITTRNPQANSMVERSHQTIRNMIRSQNIQSKNDLENGDWTGVLNAVRFAMRATLHTTMRATPMQLVYGRDAVHNIRFEADWQYLKARRQQVIKHNNERENSKRTPHTYTVGDSVMVDQPLHRKYGTPKYKGPYTVDSVNDNGTLRLRIPKGVGAIYETWNIRNIHPYSD